jgi:hypothetical protein
VLDVVWVRETEKMLVKEMAHVSELVLQLEVGLVQEWGKVTVL